MRAVLFFNVDRLGPQFIQELRRNGIEPVYGTAEKNAEVLREMRACGCAAQSVWKALLGEFPAELREQGWKPIVPEPSLLVKLANCERTVIPMLDRFNYAGHRIYWLHTLYIKYVSCWLGIFKALSPQVVVYQNNPHHAYDYVAYSLAKELGIKTLIFERTTFKDRVLLQDSVDSGLAMPRDFATEREVDEELLEYFRKVQDRQIKTERHLGRAFAAVFRSLLDVRRWTRPALDSVYGVSPQQPSILRNRLHFLRQTVAAIRLERRYRKKSRHPDLAQSFLYFPLHFQPERTTLPGGGEFWNQLYVVNVLLEILPDGWMLYVREHPRQFTRVVSKLPLARDEQFYRELTQDKRVVLIDLDVDAQELIKNASCVATVSGTAGWEAAVQGKPAIVFGHPWYKGCPVVHHFESLEESREFLQKVALENATPSADYVRKFATWVKDHASQPGSHDPTHASDFSLSRNVAYLAEAIAKRSVV